MRIFFLVLLSLFAFQLGMAESTYLSKKDKSSDHFEANTVWKKYLQCGSLKKDIEKCLSEVGTKDFYTAYLPKAYEFLALGFEVSELSECRASDKKTVPKNAKNYLCFKNYGNKASQTGFVYFDQRESKLKISKVKY